MRMVPFPPEAWPPATLKFLGIHVTLHSMHWRLILSPSASNIYSTSVTLDLVFPLAIPHSTWAETTDLASYSSVGAGNGFSNPWKVWVGETHTGFGGFVLKTPRRSKSMKPRQRSHWREEIYIALSKIGRGIAWNKSRGLSKWVREKGGLWKAGKLGRSRHARDYNGGPGTMGGASELTVWDAPW
jgi:hypothetical protein